MRRKGLLNVLVIALASILGGTRAPARAGEAPAPLQPMVTAMREIGRPGGRFVIAVPSDPRTFNPMLANETSSGDVTDRLFTALAEFDNASQSYRPTLATGWDVSADSLTWTWHLRRGACFSDGHPISSEDVRFSFQVAGDSSLHQPIYDLLLVHGQPIQVTVADSFTVVTRIRRPFALMVANVASVRILPSHALGAAYGSGRFAQAYGVSTAPESLVTSGPWRLERYAPHERTVLSRNPGWFGVDARGRRLPYLDQLVFLIVPDQNAAALKFQSGDGEVDGLDNVKPEDYVLYQKNQTRGGYTLYDLGAGLTSSFLWFNLNRVKSEGKGKAAGEPCVDPVRYAWFSNRDFRRAISMAIDRDAMIRSAFFGDGLKNWSLMTAGNRIFFTGRAPAYDHDPAGARRLLQRLGFRDRDGDGWIEDAKGNTVRFTLTTNSNSNLRVQLANFVRDDLRRIGIECAVKTVDFNTMMGAIQESFDYEAALGGLGTTLPPDPGAGANFYRSSGATHFWNARQDRPETPEEARLDQWFEAIVSTGDPASRKRIAADMERLIGEQCWIVWLPVQKIRLPVRNRFGNVQPSIIRHRLLWNIETVFVKPNGKGPRGHPSRGAKSDQ